MTETNVFQLSQPGTFTDPLTEVLRNGARALLAQAVEAEGALRQFILFLRLSRTQFRYNGPFPSVIIQREGKHCLL